MTINILAFDLGTAAAVIGLPVVVAALTTAATMVITRAGEATNRRRDRYAQAVQTLVAWIEFPYRVRRRTDDTPATLKALADLGHDLQERLAGHQAWIATEHPRLATTYATTRSSITEQVGPAIQQAWETGPTTTPADMNFHGWGPAGSCQAALAELQQEIENRFGRRRITASLMRLGSPQPRPPDIQTIG
jgi:hypothetical protein